MTLTLQRRQLAALPWLGLGSSLALQGCATLPAEPELPPAEAQAQALHALNRLGYGPRPGELAALAPGFGWRHHVEAQLNAPREPVPAPQAGALLAEDRRLQQLRADGDGEPRERRERVQAALQEAARARLQPALQSPWGLRERLVEFWANHFNVFIGKGPCRLLMADYEARAIRPHVLGRFRDLLGAVTQHPAMLIYLDNAQSRAGALNENHARELMELHTLGVDGGYTQADVTQLARVLTGWGLDPATPEGFRFTPRRHDDGPKTWLGQAVPGKGQAQGEWALDQLARHPSTARRVATQLARAFVSDTPEPALVQAVAERFRASDGDLRATTQALLLHAAARPAASAGQQFKTPYRYVLSLQRATALPADDLQPTLQAMRSLGQPLFGCSTPDGWKWTRDAWLDPEQLARRTELAARVAARSKVSADQLRATLGPALSAGTLARVAAQAPAQQAALLLASPDFLNA